MRPTLYFVTLIVLTWGCTDTLNEQGSTSSGQGSAGDLGGGGSAAATSGMGGSAAAGGVGGGGLADGGAGGLAGQGGSGGALAMEPMRIYLAPGGDDLLQGDSVSQAILTLERAQELIVLAAPERDVEVRIAPGDYFHQSVEWTYTMESHTITFMPLNDDMVRPVFDGCIAKNDASDCAHTWFRLKVAEGKPSNVHFEYIRIERYMTGISLEGDRDDFSKFNSHYVIYGCYFYRVGNKYHSSNDHAYAVVRLKNSDHNLVRNNHFVQSENDVGAGYLHALYLAHSADHNLIAKNRFKTQSGDAVRLRDYSNDNEIKENKYIKAGVNAGYTDWYCSGTNCTKPTPECPSWDNQFRDNTLDGDYSCAELSTFELFQGDVVTGCSKPSATSQRLATSGNTKTSSPCEGL